MKFSSVLCCDKVIGFASLVERLKWDIKIPSLKEVEVVLSRELHKQDSVCLPFWTCPRCAIHHVQLLPAFLCISYPGAIF